VGNGKTVPPEAFSFLSPVFPPFPFCLPERRKRKTPRAGAFLSFSMYKRSSKTSVAQPSLASKPGQNLIYISGALSRLVR
jgi:hypothetical protein